MAENTTNTTLPLPSKRDIILSKDVTAESMAQLAEKILDTNEEDDYLEKLYKINDLIYNRKPIKIYIDSYGGYVYQCFGLLAIMEKSKTPVHTFATGAAMSCGFMILIHGHKRFAYEHATPMYHQVSSVAWGKLKDMEDDVVETKRLQGKIEAMTLAKTKIPRKKIEKVYKTKKDWFMSAHEAEKYGVVDEVI
jgi:ATP-dependent Clp protease protease subunit